MNPQENAEGQRLWDSLVLAELQRQRNAQSSAEIQNPAGSRIPPYSHAANNLPREAHCSDLVRQRLSSMTGSRVGAPRFTNHSVQPSDLHPVAIFFEDDYRRPRHVNSMADDASVLQGSASMHRSGLMLDTRQQNPRVNTPLRVGPWMQYGDAVGDDKRARNDILGMNGACAAQTASSCHLSRRQLGGALRETRAFTQQFADSGGDLRLSGHSTLMGSPLCGQLREAGYQPGQHVQSRSLLPLLATATGSIDEPKESNSRAVEGHYLQDSSGFLNQQEDRLLSGFPREGGSMLAGHEGLVGRGMYPRSRGSESNRFPLGIGGLLNGVIQPMQQQKGSRTSGGPEPRQVGKDTSLPNREDWLDPSFNARSLRDPSSQRFGLRTSGSEEGSFLGPGHYEGEPFSSRAMLGHGMLHHGFQEGVGDFLEGGFFCTQSPGRDAMQLLPNAGANSASRFRGLSRGVGSVGGSDGGHLGEIFAAGLAENTLLQLPTAPVAGVSMGSLQYQTGTHADNMPFLDELGHRTAKQLLRRIVGSEIQRQENAGGLSGKGLLVEGIDITTDLRTLQGQMLPGMIFNEGATTASGRIMQGHAALSFSDSLETELYGVKDAYQRIVQVLRVKARGITSITQQLARDLTEVNGESLDDLLSVSHAYMERFRRWETDTCKVLLCFFQRDCTSLMVHMCASAEDATSRRRVNLPKFAIGLMRLWLVRRFISPYPSEKEKAEMAWMTGIAISQVNNWFINARVRIWKPIVDRTFSQDEDVSKNVSTESGNERPLAKRNTQNAKKQNNSRYEGMALLTSKEDKTSEGSVVCFPQVQLPEFGPAVNYTAGNKQTSRSIDEVPGSTSQAGHTPGNPDGAPKHIGTATFLPWASYLADGAFTSGSNVLAGATSPLLSRAMRDPQPCTPAEGMNGGPEGNQSMPPTWDNLHNDTAPQFQSFMALLNEAMGSEEEVGLSDLVSDHKNDTG